MPFKFDTSDAIMQVTTILHRFAFRAEAEEVRKEDVRRAESAIDGHASVSGVFRWDGGWAYLVELTEQES